MRLLHRGAEGFVQFMHPDPEGMGLRPMASARASELLEFCDEFEDDLRRDAYYSINSFWRPATRLAEHLRYLNTAYADLDHRGLSFVEAMGRIVRLVERGALPQPSISAFSGRGSWLYWLLEDPRTGLPPRAFREKLAAWRVVQNAIHDRLTRLDPDLGADANALDACRVTRVPGSLNGKSGQRVWYLTPRGRTKAYTLDSLADALGVSLHRTPEPGTSEPRPERRVPNNRRGLTALHERRLEELERLEAARGGFPEGCRNQACYACAVILRGLGVTVEKAAERVTELARNCSPPLPRGEALAAVESAYRRRGVPKVRNVTLAAWLGVTAEEADRLGLESVRPDFEDRGRVDARTRADDWNRAKVRRVDLRYILAEHDRAGMPRPGVRELARLLTERGHTASKSTVTRDLAILGPSLV